MGGGAIKANSSLPPIFLRSRRCSALIKIKDKRIKPVSKVTRRLTS